MNAFKSARIGLLIALLCGAPFVHASNTGGVFSPVVNEGHRSVQYRAGHDPDNHALNQRLHYEQAIDDDWMWRAIVATRKNGDRDADFDFFQAEMFRQLTRNEAWLQQGVRFDLRIRDDSRPTTLGFNYMLEANPAPGWQARLLALTALEVGRNDRDGILLGTRANLTNRVSDRWTLGLEMYSNYGSTKDIADFDDQFHQIGPQVNWHLPGGWQIFGSTLFGLTSGTPDTSLRLWLTKNW